MAGAALVESVTDMAGQPAPLAVIDRGGTLATSEVIARTKQIREVMEAVMKVNVHYGVIPGTQKPTMYQPGADVLNVTFRIAPKIGHLEDLSNDDEVRYRVTVQGIHQVSGELLAEGIGECSSSELKYRWRRPVCDEEFKDTPEDRRREVWARGKNGAAYKNKQVRTSPADVANTVLKMAVKRGKIAMTLNATAASDVFAQDLEDLSEELRESLVEEGAEPAPKPAQRASQQPKPADKVEPVTPAAPAPKPAAAPVAASKNIGTITTVDEKGSAVLVTLDTGFKCSTRDGDLMQSIGRLRDSQRRVELLTRPSSDPAKFAPVLTGIEFPGDEAPAS